MSAYQDRPLSHDTSDTEVRIIIYVFRFSILNLPNGADIVRIWASTVNISNLRVKKQHKKMGPVAQAQIFSERLILFGRKKQSDGANQIK